jgi:hypothetical protein
MRRAVVVAVAGAVLVLGSGHCRRTTQEEPAAADSAPRTPPPDADARDAVADDAGATAEAEAESAEPADVAEEAVPEEPASVAATPLPPGPDPADTLGTARRLTAPALAAHRPRFSPDGTKLAFYAGEDGKADVYVINVDGTGLARLTDDPGDDRDPTWSRTGEGLVWSTNRGGNYDLWTMGADGSNPVRFTDFADDELEPASAPVRFLFWGVYTDQCTNEGVDARQADAYDKIAFTRRARGKSEIWFRSDNGRHEGRLSAAGASCRAPAWSGNGTALSWTCDGRGGPAVFHADAQWDQDFAAAIRALRVVPRSTPSCAYDDLEQWSTTECMERLPRHYGRYPAEARSQPKEGLEESAYSANQTLLLAGGGGTPGGLRVASRAAGEWSPVPGAPEGARRPVWSPDGRRAAFESGVDGAGIWLADADFYLQDVRDLVDYPELWGAGRSALLHRNGFVARPGEEKEFFRLYERLRYARRSPFVTADAVLQTFHDEFALVLREGEQRAQEELLRLTRALYDIYVGNLTAADDPVDRYLAIYFAVPHVFLAAAQEIVVAERLPWDEESEGPAPETPVAQLEAGAKAKAARLPEWIRADVERHVAAIAAHDTIGEIRPPDQDAPAALDYTQFQVRGHYASSALAGWFVAVQWLGLAPLPLDESAFALVARLESSRPPPPSAAATGPAPPETLGDLWDHVDALIGAFLGRPVDIAVPHLRQVAREHPEWIAPFRRDDVLAALLALRGPMPFRGVEGAVTDKPPPPRFTFLPRRYGLDAEFFTRLTAPTIPGRSRPQALDVFAVLGSDRAYQLALAADEGQEWAETYAAALDALAAEHGEQPAAGFGPGDIYHSWLAMLVALARPAGLAEDSVLRFARTEAWQDRQLASALAGYAQLKHDAVLYVIQDYGAECDSDLPVYLFVEQPDLPPPRGFVDPQPRFFRALARLADRVYRDLARGEAPVAGPWAIPGLPSEDELCARYLAERLAALAEKELAGTTFTTEEEDWLRSIGAMLEAIFVRQQALQSRVGQDEGRVAQGIALATDVFNDLNTATALELAVGRVENLYVVVPDEPGRRLTHGGIFSYYEFWQPMAQRLTDQTWNDRLSAGDVPAAPAWTSSFLETRPAGSAGPPWSAPAPR